MTDRLTRSLIPARRRVRGLLETVILDESSADIYDLARTLQVFPMPDLQRYEIPYDFAVIVRLRFVQTHQLCAEILAKVPALLCPGIIQYVLHQASHTGIFKQPLRNRNPKAVLLLV